MTVYMGVLRYMDMMDAIRRQARRGLLFLFPFSFFLLISNAHRAGERVSAFIPEMMMATASVSENCL